MSDDRSPLTPKIEKMAHDEGVDFTTTEKRNSHHGGDWQACINSLVYARQEGVDVAVKISQRLIPILPEFWGCMEDAFKEESVAVCLPGQMDRRQVARPSAMFFTKFPILTDVVGMRVDCVNPTRLLEIYKDKFKTAKSHHETLVEFAWNHLVNSDFKGRTKILDQWSTHEKFKQKYYLRKSQSTAAEYEKVAKMEGLTGVWNLHDWGLIEKKQYVCRPTIV